LGIGSFDPITGTFYANAEGDAGYYLHSYNVGESFAQAGSLLVESTVY
jgi:hypothetical protein